MATEVERFEYKGYLVRIELEPRVSGVLDGWCRISKAGVEVDNGSLDPMISNANEAQALLRQAGQTLVDLRLSQGLDRD